MNRLRFGSAFMVLALCAACAAPRLRPPAAELEAGWRAHAGSVAPIRQWEIRGRLAIRMNSHGGQATLNWSRELSRQTIRLNGPFGSGAVRIVQDASGAQLEDTEGRELQADSAETLLLQYSGWQLPVNNLDWWVRGLPVPDVEAQRELDDTGRLSALRQQSWEVRYEQYVRVGELDLPQRIVMQRAPQASTPAIEARLVIDRWQQVK